MPAWRAEHATLCRYANERLTLNRAGDVVLQLKSPYHDGTTHIVMSPLELVQRLAALIPRPRLHLIRFHGVLAPKAGPARGLLGAPRTQRQVKLRDHLERAGQRI